MYCAAVPRIVETRVALLCIAVLFCAAFFGAELLCFAFFHLLTFELLLCFGKLCEDLLRFVLLRVYSFWTTFFCIASCYFALHSLHCFVSAEIALRYFGLLCNACHCFAFHCFVALHCLALRCFALQFTLVCTMYCLTLRGSALFRRALLCIALYKSGIG